MKFRLGTIAYVFALLAAGMAAFGPVGGLFTASFVGLSWLWVIGQKDWDATRPRLIAALICWFLIALTIGVLVPSVSTPRGVWHRAACLNGMRQLSLALLNYYYGLQGRLPPAVIFDEQGKPLHSWRTLMLPYLEQQALFAQVDLSKPWNDPANSQAVRTVVSEMNCISRFNGLPMTSYFAITGEQTLWPKEGKLVHKIRDRTSETILILENWQKRNSWAEPSDLTFEEAVELLTTPPGNQAGHVIDGGYFYKPSTLVNVAFANGSVASLRLPLPRELAVALLTCDGGDTVDLEQLRRMEEPEIDFTTVYAFVTFVGLAVWPGLRVWRRA